MAGRLGWILAGGAAVVAGILVQGDGLSVRIGEDAPPSAHALPGAVKDLVAAEAALAKAKIAGADDAVRAAVARRDRAQAEVDRLADEVEREEHGSNRS